MESQTVIQLGPVSAGTLTVVLVDSEIEGVDISTVTSDNYDGGYQAASHLIEQGRQKLAWIGNCKSYFSARKRFEGLRDALNDSGIAFNRQWFFEHQVATPTDPFEDSMQAIVSNIVREKLPIDGIVCASDVEALVCLRMLQEKGVGVPEQMALVGFDDITGARYSVPHLTTIRQPTREMGRRAAQLIWERVRQPKSPISRIKLPVKLIIRETTSQR